MTTTAPFPTTANLAVAGTPTRSSRRLVRTGAVSGLVAAAATTAAAAIARAVDIPLTVSAKTIPVLGFAQLTALGAVIGTILATVLARRARNPQRTFVVTTVALTALSIVPDVIAAATVATRSTLGLTHVIAAAIVIPALASRLSD